MFTHLSILECVPTYGKLSLILNITAWTDITSFWECSSSLRTSNAIFEQVRQAHRHFGRRATYHPHIRWGRWATHLEHFLNNLRLWSSSLQENPIDWMNLSNFLYHCLGACLRLHTNSSWVDKLDAHGMMIWSLSATPCRFLLLSHQVERSSWRLVG